MRNQNLRSLIESEGVGPVQGTLIDLIESGEVRLGHASENGRISIGELYNAFVGIDRLQERIHHRGFVSGPNFLEIQESDAVRSSAFSNIAGHLLSNVVIEAYNQHSAVADALVDVYRTSYRDERIPGFGDHETVEEVNEGDAYPQAGFDSKYVGPGTSIKYGRIIYLTERAIMEDQTSLLLRRAQLIGERGALKREKVVLEAVTGETACYYPNGTETALYSGTPYKLTSNGLSDWTNVETALKNGVWAMTDAQGELIYVVPKILLVPTDLLYTARRIINATQVVSKTPTSGTAGTTAQARETISQSPIAEDLQIVSSPQVSNVQSSNGDTNWWIGDPRAQFYWREIIPIQVERANPAAMANMSFERDIVDGFRVRLEGNVFAMDQKYFVKNEA